MSSDSSYEVWTGGHSRVLRFRSRVLDAGGPDQYLAQVYDTQARIIFHSLRAYLWTQGECFHVSFLAGQAHGLRTVARREFSAGSRALHSVPSASGTVFPTSFLRCLYATSLDIAGTLQLRPWMLSFRADYGLAGYVEPEVAEMLVQLILSETTPGSSQQA